MKLKRGNKVTFNFLRHINNNIIGNIDSILYEETENPIYLVTFSSDDKQVVCTKNDIALVEQKFKSIW